MTVKDHSPQHRVIDIFLWCLAAVYLFAFTSLYVQIPGLYGKDGILPAHNIIYDLTACVDSDERCPMWQSWGECKANKYWMMKHCRKTCDNCQDSKFKLFFQQFNLLLFTPSLGLDTETGMEFLSMTGMTLSLLMLVSTTMRNAFSFSVLFFLYYSQHQVGQIFLWYQWDGLLLETGFLAIIIAPWNTPLFFYKKIFGSQKRSDYSPQESVSFWLVKWLLFRLMFSSGVVKLSYMDRTWWDLTALNWHYESQCIPTPVAWYAHHLPRWFQKFSVVMTYVIEIPVPFLFFAPVRGLRLFAGFSQVLLQVLIFITGNYNFFNILTVVLCLSLIDDKFLGQKINDEKNEKKEKENTEGNLSENDAVTKVENILSKIKIFLASTTWKRMRAVLNVSSIITVAAVFVVFTAKWFSLKTTSKEPIQSKIAFSVAEFFSTVRNAIYVSMCVGLFSLVVEIVKAFWRCLSFDTRREQIYEIFKLFLFSFLSLTMFGMSLVLYTGEMDKTVQKNVPQFLKTLHDKTYHFEMLHSYGLFRSMTGIGGRPEVVIKGGQSAKGPWQEYGFLYKPGDLSKRPPYVAPHQPRVDWQMWFASLDTYDRNPWLLSLLHKLLLGKSQVLGLLDKGPFEENPPQFIKVDLYRYHFTKNDTSFWSALVHSSDEKLWWNREYVHDYTPFIINRNDTKSYENLIQHRYSLLRTDVPAENGSGFLYKTIHNLRSSKQGRRGPQLILVLFASSIALLLTKIWWRRNGYEKFSPIIIRVKLKLKEHLNKYYHGHIHYWFKNNKEEIMRKLTKAYIKWRGRRKKYHVSFLKKRPNIKYVKKTR